MLFQIRKKFWHFKKNIGALLLLHEMNKMKQEDSAVDAMLFTLQKKEKLPKGFERLNLNLILCFDLTAS